MGQRDRSKRGFLVLLSFVQAERSASNHGEGTEVSSAAAIITT